jgi:Fe-S cluster biogenesis protein NfuA
VKVPGAYRAAHDVNGERRMPLLGKERLVEDRVQAALDKIRPALQADGGDVELVEIDGGVVKVRLVGACRGCPMSQITLANGVERVLKSEVPEVERVEPV